MAIDRFAPLVILTGIPLLSVMSASAQEFGVYDGRVVTEWLSDGRTMRLLEPFSYIDPDGVRWKAPAGSEIDGASIPQIAWSAVGGPFSGKYRDASVLHDVACVERGRPWPQVHLAFYTAMRASGVTMTRAKIMYGAVYHYGPRWPPPFSAYIPPRSELSEADFERLVEAIERTEGTMTLEEIEQFR